MQIPTVILRITEKLLNRAIPPSLKLPFQYYLYIVSTECEPELKFLERICDRREVAIDVGANSGLYSYKMSKLFSKVYAFEINPETLKVLESFRSNKIVITAKGLSSAAKTATLYMPVVNKIPLLGWASLYTDNCSGVNEHEEKVVELIKLDSLNIRPVSLIKIDVEGHELDVVIGAEQTLMACQPIVIVEIKERNLAAIQRFFSRLNYIMYKLDDLTEQAGSKENFIFLPNARSMQPLSANQKSPEPAPFQPTAATQFSV